MHYKSDNELIFEQYNKNIAHILNEHVFDVHIGNRSILKFSIDYDSVNEPTRKYAELLEQNPEEVNNYLDTNFKYLLVFRFEPGFGNGGFYGGFSANYNKAGFGEGYNPFVNKAFGGGYVTTIMSTPEPITSLDNTNESGVFIGNGDYNVWWVNDINIICKYLRDLLLKYCEWSINNSENLEEENYNVYKEEIYNDLQNIGIPRNTITAALYNNIHDKYGISDDEFVDLFECVHHPINEAAPLIPIIARLVVRYGPKLLKMWLAYKARKYVADRSLRKQFEQIDAMDISDEEKLKLIKQQI